MEFCVPDGERKVGLHLKDLPPKPLIVRKVNPGSWTEAQGIRVGDVLIAVGGHRAEVLSAEHFVRLMQTRPLRLIIERLPAVQTD
jgi:C-terminal processing protease CtpA/Prc